MTKDEALKLALEALESTLSDNQPYIVKCGKAITAIKEALAQPEQEPVAFEKTVCPFCTSEWVTAEQHDRNVDRVERKPLTDEEIGAILEGVNAYGTRLYTFARAIEVAHGIKG